MKPDGLWGNIFKSKRADEALNDILREIPLFRDLTPKEMRLLQSVVHLRKYEAGETIFVEKEPGAGMYIVRTGRVNVVLHHNTGGPVVLSQLHEGDFFGETALLGETERSATAIAQESSELIGFFNPDLVEIMSLYPQMGAKICLGLAAILAERLRYTGEQLHALRHDQEANEKAVR